MPQMLPIIGSMGAGAAATSTAASVVGLSTASAVASAGAAAVAKFSLTKFLMTTAMSMALNALAMALTPKPNMQSAGISTDGVKMGADIPRSFILGTYATSCHAIAPSWVYDIDKDDNKYLTLLYGISDAPIEGVEEFWIDGRKYNLLPQVIPPNNFDDRLGMKIDGGDQRGWILYETGYQTEANPLLLELLGDFPERPYTENMKMTGVAYVVATFKHLNDDPKYTQIPDVRVVVKGKPLYDPRKDTTNGGSGAHRWGNESTYEHTNNPVVMAYNLFRGISMSPTEVYGVMAPASALPNSYWFPAMNTCDEAGTEPGGTHYSNDLKRYQAGIEISVDAEPLDEIERLLASCGAIMAEAGGQYLITVGPPRLPAAHITDESLIYDATSQFVITEGLNSIYNGVTSSYPSPQAGWESEVATPLLNPVWEAEDMGHRLLANISFSTVYSARQVRRLMREAASDNRRQRRHTIVLPPTFINLNPTDSITWTSVTNGYSSKVFEVISTSIDPDTLNVMLELRERDPNDYDYDEVKDSRTPYYPSDVVVYPTTSGVKDFGAVGVSIADAAGKAKKPAIRMFWNPDVSYNRFSFEIRLKSNPANIINGTVNDVGAGVAFISENIISNQVYEVRAKPPTTSALHSAWGAWIEVTTPSVFLTGDDFEDGVTGLFEDAGLKATRIIPNRSTPGAYVGELAWSRADNKLYQWNGSRWIDHVQNSLNGILESTMVAVGLNTIKTVSSLPATGRVGDQVFLTTDNKLYRRTDSGWTASVAAANITGAITSTQISNNAIQTPHLAAGSVDTAALRAGSVNTDILAANAVTAGKIQAGAIGVDQLAAGSIVASKLAVTDPTNYIVDGELQDESYWTIVAAAGNVSFNKTYGNTYPDSGSRGTILVQPGGANFTLIQPKNDIPASAGQEYYASFKTGASAAGGIITLTLQALDGNNTLLSSTSVSSSSTTSSWAEYSTSFTCPANTLSIRYILRIEPGQYGNTNNWIGAPILRRKNGGELIVDGSIKANHIQAQTITGGLIAAAGIITNAAQIDDAVITNAKIANLAVDTLKIANNAVTVPVSVSATNVLRISGTTETTLLSLVINRKGNPTFLNTTVQIAGYGTQAIGMFKLYRNSVLIANWPATSGMKGVQTSVAFSLTDQNRGIGNTTYQLRVERMEAGDYTGDPQIVNRTMFALHVKK